MKAAVVLPAVALLAGASAAPAKRWSRAESQAVCKTFFANVTASTDANVDLASVIGPAPASQQALVQSEVDALAAGSTVSSQMAQASRLNVSGTYELYFEYCAPKTGTPKGLFQTHHGIVGNAAYWNVLVDGVTDYSFVESAAAAGWATLSYDRLGVGKSSKPDGTQIVQIAYEGAQSAAIATSLRAGTFADLGAFSTIVGVGHSYGSALLVGLASFAPDAFDQLVLTGFSANSSVTPLGIAGFDTTIASVAYPARFAGEANDYVITPSVSVDQKEFFHYPNYTQSALDLFTTTKGEYTLGQMNTVSFALQTDRSGFDKPVFVITGENDAPFCESNCYVTSLASGQTQLNTAKGLFPGVADADFATQIVPATGHGINFHTTAYNAYQQIISFVSSHQ